MEGGMPLKLDKRSKKVITPIKYKVKFLSPWVKINGQ